MSQEPSTPITELLAAVNLGDGAARERLWARVYDELHRIAQHHMASEAANHTLQTTAVINEAYLRLVGDGNIRWASRRHFFGAAAKAMRRILVDDARRRNRLKRGGGEKAAALTDEPGVLDKDPAMTLAIDEALAKLEESDARKAEVVTLKYFGGLTVDEIAQALGIAPRTVDFEWRFARAWLHRELSKGDSRVS